MIRITIISLIIVAIISPSVHAADDSAELSIIQQECVQVGEISFGEGQQWSDCHVTKGRWVATIGLIDMYQAQYCLGNGKDACNQRALVIFGNRAYTPKAKLLVQRIDPSSVLYDDPIIIVNDYGRIMVISAHFPDGSINNNNYLWQTDQWILLDSKKWLQELSSLLPNGVAVRKVRFPDVDTMSSQVSLYQHEEDCCSSTGVENVQWGLIANQFFIKTMSFIDRKLRMQLKL